MHYNQVSRRERKLQLRSAGHSHGSINGSSLHRGISRGASRNEAEAPTHRKMLPAVSARSQIIEENEEVMICCQKQAAAARHLVKSKSFDIAIGVAILLNAASIGVEQTLQIEGHSTTPVQVIESMFLCVYIFELGCRIVAFGCECFKDNWVKFDFFLIVIGVLNTWIVEPLVEDSPDALGLLMVLRVLRLLRLAKSARLLKQAAEFWRLIRGFLNSATITFYTLLIVFVALYVFSSLAVELITKHRLNIGSTPDQAFQQHVDLYFSSLPQTLWTLVRFVTLDDINIIYRPLVEKDPWLALYFLLLMLVVGIVLMNLVTAVIFSSTLEMEQDEHDEVQHAQEEEWARLIRDLKEMFTRLDTDQSGHLSREEIMCMDPDDREVLVEALGVTTPEKVFNALDIDRNGTVSINEFFDGIWDVVLARGSVDLKRLEKQVETMHWRIKETFGLQHELRLSLDRVVRIMETLYDQTGEVRSNVTMSTTGSNVGSNMGFTGKAPGVAPAVPFEAPDWAKELNESLQQLLKDKNTVAKRSRASLREKDTVSFADAHQNKEMSFRDYVKDQSKGGRTISLDRSEPNSPDHRNQSRESARSSSPANQNQSRDSVRSVASVASHTEHREVKSVITSVKVESTTVESQPAQDRKYRMRRATMQTAEAKEASARLKAISGQNADVSLKHI